MSNPQQSGSQQNQGTQHDREKQGAGHQQQQQQPGNQKSGQFGNDPNKQGQTQHGDTGQRNK